MIATIEEDLAQLVLETFAGERSWFSRARQQVNRMHVCALATTLYATTDPLGKSLTASEWFDGELLARVIHI